MRARLVFLFAVFLLPPGYSMDVAKTESLMESATLERIKAFVAAEKKPLVLLNIWSTWCEPCQDEFPILVKIQNKYRDQLTFVAVSLDFDDQINAANVFLKSKQFSGKAFHFPGNQTDFVANFGYGFRGTLPFTVLLNKAREAKAVWFDAVLEESLEKELTKLSTNRVGRKKRSTE